MFLMMTKYGRRMVLEDNIKYVKKYLQFRFSNFTSYLTSLQKAASVTISYM
jgi:hypothetical protein